jgi:hypothetical protein
MDLPTNLPGRSHLMQVTTVFRERDEPSSRISGTDSSFWDLACVDILGDGRGHHDRGSRGVLIGYQRGEAPVKESPY